MGKRYDRVSYSQHAREQLAARPLITEADIELSLNEGMIRKGEGEGLIAEYPVRERLALWVIFLEATPHSAYVVTVYPISRRRTGL